MNEKLQFELPNDQWEPAEPMAGQLFLAARKGEFRYFRPNISADVARLQPQATLEQVADVVAGRLRRFDQNPKVIRREVRENGTTAVQRVDFSAQVTPDVRVQLSQFQFIMEMPLVDAGDERAVMSLVLTAETERMAEYMPDFEKFLASAQAVPDRQAGPDKTP